MQRLGWDDFQTLLMIERFGSLRAAAAELGVHTATMGRRLDGIEERFGHKLYDRSHRPLRIHPFGKELVEAATRMERVQALALDKARDELSEIAGRLVVGLPDASVASLLMPALGHFFRAHPALQPTFVTYKTTLDAAQMSADLRRGQLDVVLMLSPSPAEDLFGRRLAAPCYGFFGLPDLGEEESLNLVGWRYPTDDQAYFPRDGDPGRVACRTDTMLSMFEAAKVGLGVAFLPLPLAATCPDLRRYWPDIETPGPALWVLCLEGAREVQRIRALMGFLGNALRR